MIKKSLKAFVVLVALVLTVACSKNDVPELGKQYSQLPADLSQYNLSPVTEIFSLTCGHCRNMEQMIPEIEKQINQEVGKVHVTFNQSAQVAALIYYSAVMQLDGKPDEALLESLFATVQMQDVTMSEQQQAIEEAFTSRNLKSPYKMDETEFKELNKLVTIADRVTKDGQINSVPTFIVGGKYQIITEGHESIEDLAKTMNYLLTQN
ncbi:thioredoxin domain-containing protein [Vibrio hannami]|uniref:thioredoxin domain-containing protein n=1 Tax=Vibrio hannami TaxID=2717094 RepID=UPI0024102C30|nr:thioredoxin domain-containing protein [Vibrio hannami]MDG3085671.1 thioredoxin domain-containing protein [Vibrio hannami]